jgi:DNA recombination protein RmuC
MEWMFGGLLGAMIGGAIAAAVAWLLADRRCRAQNASLLTDVALAEQKCADLSEQYKSALAATEVLRGQAAAADRNAAALSAQLEATRQNLLEQKKLLDDAYAQLSQAFASVSAEALARNNEAFLHLAREKFAALSIEATGSLEQRKAQIEGLLKPMQELLNSYQQRLGEVEKSRVESYSMLREQLGTLTETQRTLNLQTSQLVTALRRPQTRGQWGEITLRRLVELAGMSARCDFVEQGSIEGEDGRMRPDMLINLPGERQIVIDCKAALDAFLDAAAAADEDQRKQFLQRHCQQVRSRARELSAKSYWSQFKRSPEYVIMFLPGEAFLYAAIEQDGSIIEEFLRSNVIIATPTTLMALLRVIEFGWRQELVAENAEAIQKHGRELYERIATLGDHFAKLGASIDGTVENYNKTIGSLESRVFVTARKIAELGARSDKEPRDIEPVDVRTRELSASLRVATPLPDQAE